MRSKTLGGIDRKKQVVWLSMTTHGALRSALSLEVLYEPPRLGSTRSDADPLFGGVTPPQSDEEIRRRPAAWGTARRGTARLQGYDDCTCGESRRYPRMVEPVPQGRGAVMVGALVAHKFTGWSGGAKIFCPACRLRDHLSLSLQIMLKSVFSGQREHWFSAIFDTVGSWPPQLLPHFVPAIGGNAGWRRAAPGPSRQKHLLCEKAMAAGFAAWADLVLVSAYRHHDLWQSGKGFYIGDMLVKDGGTLILVTPLEEGLGDHPDFIALLDRPPADILELLAGNRLSDPLAAVASYAIRRIGERCSLRIVTGNSTVRRPLLGAPITGELQSVVDSVRLIPGSSVAVLNDSYVLPRLDTET